MYAGQYVFAQLMDHLPWHVFRRCVARYGGDRKVKSFSCLDQFRCLAFAQLTWRESLRDIEACLRAQSAKLYHLGFRCEQISRNTMANANAERDWRIYADFAQHLIRMARELYTDQVLPGLEGLDTVYALDSSTIDLCLSVFPWAPFRSAKGAIKLHTLLDLRGSIPSFIFISDGKMHDVNILDHLVPEAGAFYVMDRGYVDYGRLASLDGAGSFFVTRAKSNMKVRRRYSHPVDRTTGLICDQTVVLTGFYARQDFPRPLRRVRFNDPETGKSLVFLTNNFALPALTIACLYNTAGRSNSFSNGSSSTCASRRSSAPPKTPSRRKSGQPSASMCWLPSSKSASASRPASTKCYRFSVSCFSKKASCYSSLPIRLCKWLPPAPITN